MVRKIRVANFEFFVYKILFESIRNSVSEIRSKSAHSSQQVKRLFWQQKLWNRSTFSSSIILILFFRLTAMEFLSGFRSNCSFYYLDPGLYFSVLPRQRCQEFTYSELVSVLFYSSLSSPFGYFTVSEFLMNKDVEFNIKTW